MILVELIGPGDGKAEVHSVALTQLPWYSSPGAALVARGEGNLGGRDAGLGKQGA